MEYLVVSDLAKFYFSLEECLNYYAQPKHGEWKYLDVKWTPGRDYLQPTVIFGREKKKK